MAGDMLAGVMCWLQGNVVQLLSTPCLWLALCKYATLKLLRQCYCFEQRKVRCGCDACTLQGHTALAAEVCPQQKSDAATAGRS
jgi:hypothetical protein